MMLPRLTLDYSPDLVIVLCSCGWRDDAPDRPRAWLLGVDHAYRVHSDHRLAESARVSAMRCARTAGDPRHH